MGVVSGMRPRLLLSVLGLLACTEPRPAGIGGTYLLVSAYGHPLPAAVTSYYVGTTPRTGAITSGMIVMAADSTFAQVEGFTDASGQVFEQPTVQGRWYHADPTAPEYQILPDGSTLGAVATLRGDTLTLWGRDYVRR